MSIESLRSPKERPLFTIALVVSILFWLVLVVGTLGIGLLYVVFGVLFYLIAHAVFLARIKGNGVRITAHQLPELHQRIVDASKKLGLDAPPDAYLLNDRGGFNAFATRYLGHNFVVLYSDLLEGCDEQDGSIDFIIGHEIAHLAFGHLRWNGLLLPSRLFPLLGPAYSRACEYSCDRAGASVTGSAEAAVAGLSVLAAGGRYAKRLSLDAYLQQRLETGKFWMAVLELGMSHPYLPKRVGALVAQSRPDAVPDVARNPAAYVLAPFFGAAGAGGAATGAVMMVAIVGMLAAIAIPNFLKYQQRAAEAAAKTSALDDANDLTEQLEQLRREAEQAGANEELDPETAGDVPALDDLVAPPDQVEEAAEPEPEPEPQPRRSKRSRRTRE